MASDNISVAIKSRPLIDREKREKLTSQWNIDDKNIFQVDENSHRVGEPYFFDHIFTKESTNNEVYDAIVGPLIKSCMEGFNSTIFAYGQTSSGKTHTMMGDRKNPGIIQLAVNDIFAQLQHNTNRRYLISCSYFEIYNEKIIDLLDENGQDLKVREDYDGNTFITAKEEVVTVPNQVYDLMNSGNKTRKIASTNMNERSSRSHTIFRFIIESTDNDIDNGPVQVSQLNLVDLAGSERVAQTKAQGQRLEEGKHINKSLSVLGNVIRQLSDCERHISYRDSKLTRLLQPALGGNAKSLIIATITPAAGEETKSTLEFAQRAKAVKNKPIINKILSEGDKLKKYESITAGYKERLEMEKRRMKEMEVSFQREKIEHEKEIDKLKQQCKLIDLFTKGPQASTTHSKVSRRHTVGHYTRFSLLETIPEQSAVPSTSYKKTSRELSHQFELLPSTSRDSGEKSMNIIFEESEESVTVPSAGTMDEELRLDLSPEPSECESMLHQGGETPPSILRKRLRSLEDSYVSLKEFTRLETECKEDDASLIQQLLEEKENLTKDRHDLNIMYTSERLEKEKLNSENVRLFSRLAQLETENDLLKVARGRDLTDHQFLLEERTKNYEKQLNYMREEINRLNEHASEEGKQRTSEAETLRSELKQAQDENRLLTIDLMERLGKIQQLEHNIFQIVQKEELMQIQNNLEIEAEREEINSVREEHLKIQRDTDLVLEEVQLMQVYMESLKMEKENEAKKLENRIKLLEDENQDYKVKVEDLQRQLTCTVDLFNKVNEADKEKMTTLSEDKTLLERKIESMQLEVDSLKMDKEKVVDTLEQKMNSFQDSEAQIKELQEENNSMKKDIHSMQLIMESVNIKKEKEVEILKEKIKSFEQYDRIYKKQRNKLEELKVQLNDAHKLIELNSGDKDELKEIKKKNAELEEENYLLKQKVDSLKCMQLEMETELSTMEQTIKHLEEDNEYFRKLNIHNEKELQIELKNAFDEIEQLKKRVVEETDRNSALTEEIDNCTRDVGVLSELLSLGNEERVMGIIEEHQGLLELFQSQLTTYSNQIATDCNMEMDQFVAYLLELKNITSDSLLNEEINMTLFKIESGAEDFINLLEEFSKNLSNSNNPNYTESAEKINSLKVYVREKLSYMTYAQLQNRQLQNKIYKETQYLDQLSVIREGITENKNKDKMIENLQVKLTDLSQQITVDSEKYEKRIIELESTVAKLRSERDELRPIVEETTDTATNLLKIVKLTKENATLKTELTQIRSECDQSTEELARLKTSIENLQAELQNEKSRHQEVDKKLETLRLENISLSFKNLELKNLKGATPQGILSSATDTADISDSAKDKVTANTVVDEGRRQEELSPKEIRRRKRHSLQDQRRRIDLQDGGDILIEDGTKTKVEKELRDEIEKLKIKINDLTEENKFLEFEVQGFIGELEDYKRYNDEKYMEIQKLKEQIKTGKISGPDDDGCSKCESMDTQLQAMEKLHKANTAKMVEMQTTIYDMRHSADVERNKRDEVDRFLRYQIKELERKLGKVKPAMESCEVQCNILNYETLLAKYNTIKRLAQLRREEANLLRAKLGMQPDQPLE